MCLGPFKQAPVKESYWRIEGGLHKYVLVLSSVVIYDFTSPGPEQTQLLAEKFIGLQI